MQLQPRRSHSQDSTLINHPISLCTYIHIYHYFLGQKKGKTMRSFANKQPPAALHPGQTQKSPSVLIPSPSISLLLPHTAMGLCAPRQSAPTLGVLGMRQPWRHGTWHMASRHSMGLALCPCPLPSGIYETPFSTVPALQRLLPGVWSKGRRSREIHRHTPK